MNPPPNKNRPQENIDVRMRTMRTLWIALLLSVAIYYGFTLFSGRSENVVPNSTLSLTFMVVSISTILISFFVKNKLLTRAIDQRQVQMVQQAYVVTWAMAEVAALLGILDFFTTGNPYYYLLMIIAAAGQLLHYPRREHVEKAAFNRSTF